MDKKGVGGSNPAAQNSGKLSDYEIMTKLGQGSFGVVYKVKRKRKFCFNLISFEISNPAGLESL